MKWTIIILLAGLLYGYLGCIQLPPCAKDYAFEFHVSVTPQDTFTVGDTIWWEMNVPNQMLDQKTGAYVDLTDFELFFGFLISKIDSTEPITGSGHTHLFTPVEDIGRIQQHVNTLAYTYFIMESTQDKRLRLGFIPTEKGSFNSTVYFPAYYYNLEQDQYDQLEIVDSTCRETLTYNSRIIVNNKEINYYIAEGTCRYNSRGERSCFPPASELTRYNTYAFHVKEP